MEKEYPEHRDKELEDCIHEAIESGNKVWVIGDIHGYRKTLEALVSRLDLQENDILICLGDMVDRGPDSVGVVELFMNQGNWYALLGNHEEMMMIDWSKTNGFGNYSTNGFWSSEKPLSREKMLEIMGFMSSLPTEIVLDRFRLVHAGYADMPYSTSLDEQTDEQRLWSRDVFTVAYPLDPDRTIIVGHTIIQNYGVVDDDTVWSSSRLLLDGRPSAIGIDTGIFLKENDNPRITAIELESGVVVSQKRLNPEKSHRRKN